MVWLLSRVVRDRPGILSEITLTLKSRSINIRNVIGNSHALMLELENHGLSDVFYEIRGIRDIEPLGLFSFPVTPLSFSRELFMRASSSVLSSIGVDFSVFRRIGYEYGRETAKSFNLPPRESVYTGLMTATAFNRLRLVDLVLSGNEIQVVITEPFDADFNLQFTMGFIHGLVNESFKGLYSITYRRDGDTYRIVLSRV
ncbi:hypothetical protein B7L70_07735 [Vulcanisaeta sp. EB80]|uniref:hypothetical protein n=1 Tax=Vulcanisaeta sp. EB80 TaxID=1650660 RepID=UPI0009BDFB2B|nr:hypothetical protein [Vulcanisaeta sp. EB80]PLC67627.1 hypothetical protein B7L70_07735 [Vulcanisaeta sp. EB80]